MTVILRQSNDIKDVDKTLCWFAVTGTNVDLDPGCQLSSLGHRLEKAFDEVRDNWWKIAKHFGQSKSGKLAHMPTAASYNSDFGLMMAWVLLTKSICGEPFVCLVVCDDPWLFRELAKIKCVEAGRIPTLWLHIVRKWIRGYLARTLLTIRVIITAIKLRNSRERIGKGNKILLIYGHPSSLADGFDAYFGSLMKVLPSLKRLIHTDADLKDAKRLSSERTTSLHAWGSVWYAPSIIFRLWRPQVSDLTREFSWLVRRSIIHENSTAALATNSWQIHCQLRFLALNKPKLILWPWENHPWERELCRMAKKLGVKTIGYQHAVIGPHQYNTSPASNPDGLESIPERIICSGPAYYEQLIRWGMPKERLIIGGAFRISKFKGDYYDPDGPVFVATSSDTEITKLMMRAVGNVENKKRKFLIKIHPLYPKKIKESENIEITHYTIPEQSGISAVFYGTGMSGLEGLLAGVPTFRLRPEDRIAVNVLPEGVEAIPVSKEELGVALDNAVKPIPLDWEKIYAPIAMDVWKNELELSK